ncbi:MAG: hypothetical protein ACRC9R_11345, partial [Enterovibrio sp.]
ATQAPQLWPMPVVPPAPPAVVPALPVFATPATTASTTTAQLAPVVQPFDVENMTLEELLEQGTPQAPAPESLDDLSDGDILDLFDD